MNRKIYLLLAAPLMFTLSCGETHTEVDDNEEFQADTTPVDDSYEMGSESSFKLDLIIANNIAIKKEEVVNLNFEYYIAVGHFDTNQKQFDKLIEAYSKSMLPKNQVHLVILGKGKKQLELENLAKETGVTDTVHFLGFQENPYKYMKNAKAFVLSSWHEGHPMVLIEALCCDTPVIAFDCPTGPREVVSDYENGLLIEEKNFEGLTMGLNTMIRDETLHKKCKDNALKSTQKFSIEVIGNQWLDLMTIKN